MRSAGGRLGALTIARMGVLAALILALGFVERQFVLVAGVPGIKLGLSNAILLIALILLGAWRAWTLMLIKVVLGGFLYAGVTGMLYGLAGGVTSMCAMCFALSLKRFGCVGVSVWGAVAHILGQVIMSRALIGSWAAAAQLPVLIAASAVTGAVTGAVCAFCLKSALAIYPSARLRLTTLKLTRESAQNK